MGDREIGSPGVCSREALLSDSVPSSLRDKSASYARLDRTYIIIPMIITLILFTSVLSLVHHLGLERDLHLLLNQPVEYYVGVTCLLIVFRVALFFYKFLPLFRRIYRFLMRVNDGDTTQVVVRKNGKGPFSNGGTSTRLYSSSPHPKSGNSAEARSLIKSARGGPSKGPFSR